MLVVIPRLVVLQLCQVNIAEVVMGYRQVGIETNGVTKMRRSRRRV